MDALKAKPETLILPADKNLKGKPTSGLPGADGKTAGTSISAAATKASSSAADQKPVEYTPLNGSDGKPIDFVLQQALNQLKGLPVASSPRALIAAAANTAPPAVPKAVEAKK